MLKGGGGGGESEKKRHSGTMVLRASPTKDTPSNQ